MTVYVDTQNAWGWKIRGREVESCHMFTDQVDLTELHEMATRIGLQLRWFQDKKTAPHYDLVPSKRLAALNAGAVSVTCRVASGIWKARRAALAAIAEGKAPETPIPQGVAAPAMPVQGLLC